MWSDGFGSQSGLKYILCTNSCQIYGSDYFCPLICVLQVLKTFCIRANAQASVTTSVQNKSFKVGAQLRLMFINPVLFSAKIFKTKTDVCIQ